MRSNCILKLGASILATAAAPLADLSQGQLPSFPKEVPARKVLSPDDEAHAIRPDSERLVQFIADAVQDYFEGPSVSLDFHIHGKDKAGDFQAYGSLKKEYGERLFRRFEVSVQSARDIDTVRFLYLQIDSQVLEVHLPATQLNGDLTYARYRLLDPLKVPQFLTLDPESVNYCRLGTLIEGLFDEAGALCRAICKTDALNHSGASGYTTLDSEIHEFQVNDENLPLSWVSRSAGEPDKFRRYSYPASDVYRDPTIDDVEEFFIPLMLSGRSETAQVVPSAWAPAWRAGLKGARISFNDTTYAEAIY